VRRWGALAAVAALGGCSFAGLFDVPISPDECGDDARNCVKNAYADDDCV